MIPSILQYYIDYENTIRFAQSSLADKYEGEYFNRGVLKQGSSIYSFLQTKKASFIYGKMLEFLNIKNLTMRQESEALLNELIPNLLEGKLEADAFIQALNFKYPDNESAAKSILYDIIQRDQLTVCYPLLTKVVKNKKMVHPLIIFSCQLNQDDTLQVTEFTLSREALTIVAAYCENQSCVDIEAVKSQEIAEVMQALRDCPQSNIDEILKILYRELITRFEQREPTFLENPKDFKRFEGWQMLEQAFVTHESFGDLVEPIFRKELQRVRSRMETLPSSLLKKYLVENDQSQSFETNRQDDLFHWGSYTNKYPVNEKQWEIIGRSELSELLSVNGPPGTGKTTLLKELIADYTVRKTKLLLDIWDSPWELVDAGTKKGAAYRSPLGGTNPYSIVITSTNNTAVDNIGNELRKEIPFLGSFLNTLPEHPENTSGLFCARLGKNENMESFRQELVKALLNGLHDDYEAKPSFDSVERYKQNHELLDHIRLLLKQWNLQQRQLSPELEECVESEESLVQAISTYKKMLEDKQQEMNEAQFKAKQYLEASVQAAEQSQIHLAVKEQISTDLSEKDQVIKNAYLILETFRKRKFSFFRFFLPSYRKYVRHYISESYIEEELISKAKQDFEDSNQKLNWHATQAGLKANESNKLTDDSNHWQKKYEHLDSEMVQLSEILSNLQNYLHTGKQVAVSILQEGENFDIWSASPYQLANSTQILGLRHQLFLDSLEVVEQYIIKHRHPIRSNMEKILGRKWFQPFYSTDHQRDIQYKDGLMALWETFFICFPVVTTTLHAFREDTFQLLPGFMDTLFVDEAGQILPHYLCAPLYRARKAIVVGDVEQLEPVRTVRLDLINSYTNISEALHSSVCVESNSVQHYVDRHADWFENFKGQRVGLLLTEHRRCEASIMRFSNHHVYDNKLFITNQDNHDKLFGRNMLAFDVRGANKGNTNETEIQFCRRLIDKYKEVYGPDIVTEIAIIAPFYKQVQKLTQAIPEVKSGTVHSFQGQERKIILFTSVIDSYIGKQSGLASFIGGKSNMLNVALSRAKEQFVWIGNLDAMHNLNQDNFLYKLFKIMVEAGACFSPYDNDNIRGEFKESFDAEAYLLYADPVSEDSSSSLFQNYLKEHFPTGIILKPIQHHTLLLQAIQLASKSIHILSPWMLHTVVDKPFLHSLQESIERGVDIRIGFGYKPSKFTLADIDKIVQLDNFGSGLEKTQEAIEELFRILQDQLAYVPPIHSKILLVDYQFLFIGSHNWLSNKGRQKRDEISCLLTKQESIEYVRKQYLEPLFSNSSGDISELIQNQNPDKPKNKR